LAAAISAVSPAALRQTSAAAANTSQPSFATGFADYHFSSPSSSVLSDAFDHARSLGSTFVRLTADWAAIAPAHPARVFNAANPGDPSYRWSELDQAVKEATAAGQIILLEFVDTPSWAEEHPPHWASPGAWRPDPSALGAFAHAAAERYSGSFHDPSEPGAILRRVSRFQVWNEPNLSRFLEPQWGRTSKGTLVPLSPAWYRRMVNAVYMQVKAVQPQASVILAGTAPYGDLPGGPRMTPVAFLRDLLCLSGSQLRPAPCPNPVHFDGFDHHPYGPTPTFHAAYPEDVSMADLGKLRRIVDAAVRTGRALPAGPKPLWVTEWGFDSYPPERGHLSLGVQARYLALGAYELWRQGVRYAGWWTLFDEPAAGVGFSGEGVLFSDGHPKPSAAAYAFPFVALRSGGGEITVWGLAREQGVVVIEQHASTGWRPVARARSNSSGTFYTRVHRGGAHLVLRAAIGSRTSQAWTTG
jgi:hypothetical protein